MPRLIPNPAGDLLKRVDTTIESVAPVLEQVEMALLREVPEMKQRIEEIHASVTKA